MAGCCISCRSCCRSICRRLKNDLLLVLIILGAVLGFVIGAFINGPIEAIVQPEDRRTAVMLIGFPGELFMNMLKLVILPLIVASLISALASLDPKATGKIGRRVLLFYFLTTVSAAILGLVLVLSIRPGRVVKPVEKQGQRVSYRTLDSFLDLLRSLFPSNILTACFFQYKTKYSSDPGKYESYNTTENVTSRLHDVKTEIINNGTHNITMVTKEIYPPSSLIPAGTQAASGTNVIGIAMFCVLFGIILSRMKEKADPLRAFFTSMNDAVMRLVMIFMWFSPIGICSIVAAKVGEMGDILGTLQMVGLFIATVISTILIHGFVVLPLMYFTVTRKNPFSFMFGMGDALVTAFGISSSAAALPTTIRCAEENCGVDERVAKFVLPLGATVNMDGGAIFESCVVIFIAQMNGVPMEASFLFTTVLMATAISVGAAGIPSAGFIYPVIVLQSVGLPVEDLALILPVEWLLDRFRTTVNVWGDSVGAGIVNHLSRDDLRLMDLQTAEQGELNLVNHLALHSPTFDSSTNIVQHKDGDVVMMTEF